MTTPLPAFPNPVAEYLRLSFPEPPPGRPYVYLNMVSSADGKAAVGRSESALSSPTDKLVLQALRVHADAILNGSATARATGVNPGIRDAGLREWRTRLGRPKPPLQVLLSRSGDLSPDARYFHQSAFDLVVFVSGAVAPERIGQLRATGKDVEILSEGKAGLLEMLKRLRDRGVRYLLLEGGPSLNASLFHAGVVDEFFLTLGPHIVGGASTITPVEGDPFTAETMPSLDLVSALPSTSTSEVYLRWRVRYRGD